MKNQTKWMKTNVVEEPLRWLEVLILDKEVRYAVGWEFLSEGILVNKEDMPDMLKGIELLAKEKRGIKMKKHMMWKNYMTSKEKQKWLENQGIEKEQLYWLEAFYLDEELEYREYAGIMLDGLLAQGEDVVDVLEGINLVAKATGHVIQVTIAKGSRNYCIERENPFGVHDMIMTGAARTLAHINLEAVPEKIKTDEWWELIYIEYERKEYNG